ncbi:MAG: serine/threonine-protein kinase [Myxococcota bacterium]
MDERLPDGTLFGSYRIQGMIASGGMGQVYAAEHSVYGSAVALKVLHPALHADQGWRARFNEEGLVGTRLKHPHVLSARELVESDGRIALVVDLVPGGQTLEKVVAREFRDGIALETALRVFLRILQGMDYLHGKGIVHGDLKPENVMLEGDFRRPVTWTPKVTDFGTVALIAHPVEIDGRPAVVATPRYASPEHLYGVDRVEVRSDVYCLALILHFLLSGRHASNATNVREAAEFVLLPVPIVHLVDQPETLIEVFKKATAADPAARYESVRAMALAIRDVLEKMGLDLERADVAADIATEVDEDRAKQRSGEGSASQAATEPLTREHEAMFEGEGELEEDLEVGDIVPPAPSAPAPQPTPKPQPQAAQRVPDTPAPLAAPKPQSGTQATGPKPVQLSPDDVQEPIRKPTPVPVARARAPGAANTAGASALPLLALGGIALVLVLGLVVRAVALNLF